LRCRTVNASDVVNVPAQVVLGIGSAVTELRRDGHFYLLPALFVTLGFVRGVLGRLYCQGMWCAK